MKTGFVVRAAAGLMVVGTSAAAFAQAAWTPGSEIVGQPVQVTTEGVTNTVYFDTVTTQRIVTPNNNVLNGSWSAASQQLCMVDNSVQECWPYAAPFQAGVPVTLTSLTSGKVSTWVATATNAAAPVAGQKGERGR
jgi:hypothetical protein